MRGLKILAAAVLVGTVLTVTTGQVALAQTVDPLSEACKQSQGSSVCEATADNPLYGSNGVITKATQIVATLVGVAAVIMIIIGGFKYITSTGDPNSVNSAKNTILYAVIGLVIALSAQAIAIFVLRKL